MTATTDVVLREMVRMAAQHGRFARLRGCVGRPAAFRSRCPTVSNVFSKVDLLGPT
jgi:hypothetical protein